MTRALSALVVAAALIVAGCGDEESPSGPGANTFFTATVDGQPFTASTVVALTGVNNGRGYLSLTGVNGCGASNIQILMNAYELDSSTLAVGTYSTTNFIQIQVGTGATTTQRELTGQIAQNNQSWVAPSNAGSGSGTLTITSLTGGYVEGAFSLTTVPDFGNSSGTNRSATGTFRAKIEDKRIC